MVRDVQHPDFRRTRFVNTGPGPRLRGTSAHFLERNGEGITGTDGEHVLAGAIARVVDSEHTRFMRGGTQSGCSIFCGCANERPRCFQYVWGKLSGPDRSADQSGRPGKVLWGAWRALRQLAPPLIGPTPFRHWRQVDVPVLPLMGFAGGDDDVGDQTRSRSE